jgi:hypothetical protein
MNFLLRIVFSPFNSIITTAIILFDGILESCGRVLFSLGRGTVSELSEYAHMVQFFFQRRIAKFAYQMGAIKNFLFRN